MKTVINKTSQSWKLNIMYVSIFISGTLMIYGALNIKEIPAELFLVNLGGGSIIGLLGFVFACANIKCPECGAKWFWLAVSEKGFRKWLFWLISLEVCPDCGEPKNDSFEST